MAQKKSATKKSQSSRAKGTSRKTTKKPAVRATAGPRVQERRLVREVMTVGVKTLRPTDTAAEAARQMRDLDVGMIPVCKEDRLVGVVTDRDITIRVIAEGKDPNMVQLWDCCSSQGLGTAEPGWSVEKAADVMAEHQIRRLPVVDEGVLVGIISLGDLAVKMPKPEPATKALQEISQPARPQTRSQKAIA